MKYVNCDPLPVEEWSYINMMAYIAKKYNEKFNCEYLFTYETVISKSFEYKTCATICRMLNLKAQPNFRIVKDYIDWFYANYKSKKKFTSFRALAKLETIERFEKVVRNKIVNKNDPIPDNIKLMLSCSSYDYVQTYKELLFVYNYYKTVELKPQDKAILDAVFIIVDVSKIEE